MTRSIPKITGDDQPECTYLKQTQTDRQHIFTVNDSAEYLEVIRELLQDERYNVTTTNVVSLTFDAISALDPSVLMIDLVSGRPGRRSPCRNSSGLMITSVDRIMAPRRDYVIDPS